MSTSTERKREKRERDKTAGAIIFLAILALPLFILIAWGLAAIGIVIITGQPWLIEHFPLGLLIDWLVSLF